MFYFLSINIYSVVSFFLVSLLTTSWAINLVDGLTNTVMRLIFIDRSIIHSTLRKTKDKTSFNKFMILEYSQIKIADGKLTFFSISTEPFENKTEGHSFVLY